MGTALCVLAFALVGNDGLAAQTLRGSIVDATSGEPVSLSFVGLLAEGREMVVSTLGGASGEFSLTAPEAGFFLVYVARSGYSTVMDGLFELGENGVVDVRIGLRPEPMALEPIVVEAVADRSALERAGFYDRAALGGGHFLLRDEISRIAPSKLTDAFDGVPQLEVLRARPIIGLRAELNPEVRVLRAGEYCSPALYVDGALVVFGSRRGTGRAVRPDDFVSSVDVEAVEVYTRLSDIPLGVDEVGGCGVIMIWTRAR